jgi:adenylate cyclase
MPPGKLVSHLSTYFGVLERAVHDAGGILDKFVGDGMLAFFKAPHLVRDHAARACEAALGSQRSLMLLSRQDGDVPPFQTRIGLATEEVLVGNIGTAQRLSYTVIGNTVNLACWLDMLNKAYGTGILASGEVRHAAGSDFEWRHLDRVTVPGRSEPLELYELLGRVGDVDAVTLWVRDLHEDAVQDLVASRFDDAERGFRAILDKAPHDRPARYLPEHTMFMRRSSPACCRQKTGGACMFIEPSFDHAAVQLCQIIRADRQALRVFLSFNPDHDVGFFFAIRQV